MDLMNHNSFFNLIQGLALLLITIGSCYAQNLEICKGEKEGTLLPYPGNCSLYYSCSRGIGWQFTCDPWIFNPDTTMCDYPTNVPQCRVGENGCPLDGHKFIFNKNSCKKYYICANGRSFDAECADALLFDKTAERCDKPENVDCSYANPCEFEEHGTFMPGYKCNEYYVCYFGRSMMRTCIDGYEYDPEVKECVESVNGCSTS